MPFETALTKALDLRVPVLAAPLGRGTSAEFLAAMANSGSFGFTALMHMPEATVSDELAEMSRVTNGRFGANLTLVVDQRKSLADAVARECGVYSEVLCSAATLQTMDNYSATRLALRE